MKEWINRKPYKFLFYFYFGKNLIISIMVSKVSEYYYISVGINFLIKKNFKNKTND